MAIFGGRKALPSCQFSAKTAGVSLMNRIFPAILLAFLTAVSARAQSPYESSADFAKYAMKLRQEALLKVEPQVFVPTTSRNTISRYPWKTNIVTTVFWVGEQAGGNNPVPNVKSSWDANWSYNYGGFDNPEASARRNYIPVSFVPRQNPFYCALPYNDVTHGQFKPEAAMVIPWFRQSLHRPGAIRLQVALGRHSPWQPHRLRAMGRLRTVPHGSFSICFSKRTPETESESRCRTRCFTSGPRLSWIATDGCDRLAICRSARCSARTVAQLRRQ